MSQCSRQIMTRKHVIQAAILLLAYHAMWSGSKTVGLTLIPCPSDDPAPPPRFE